MIRFRCVRSILPTVLQAMSTLAVAAPIGAQITASDYARAEAFLGWNAQNLVSGDQVSPVWLEGDRFWFRSHVLDGHEFVLVDPTRGVRRPVFDHHRLAAALSLAADTTYEGRELPFQEFEFVDGERAIRFHLADSVRWSCDIQAYRCTGPDSVPKQPREITLSPNGRWAAFERDENLWVRNVETGDEVQLSSEGEENYGYAVQPEGCCGVVTGNRNDTKQPPVLVWSDDSEKIATHRFDERAVRVMALLETNVKGPVLHTYRNALPADSVVPT